jgi:hypothetical protein
VDNGGMAINRSIERAWASSPLKSVKTSSTGGLSWSFATSLGCVYVCVEPVYVCLRLCRQRRVDAGLYSGAGSVGRDRAMAFGRDLQLYCL